MFELNVPFLEKDQVKGLGARWNTNTKKWFVPSGLDPEIFRKWWPAELSAITITHEEAAISSAGCRLSVFLTKVKNVINQAFPDREWIIAEISEISLHNGNYFVTLVEYDESGHKQAQVNARIWHDKATTLMQKFKNATDSDLVAGIKVLLLANISFHPQYGLFVTIDDIDPAYTLGDMAAKINKIKEILQQERIFEKNKSLIPPTEFTRVAVISPYQAAGLGDFTREADLLAKYNLCEWCYFTATFQGKSAPNEIISALQHVVEEHKAKPFDAVVIIRGGGSVADLAWLNDLDLARAICLCPLYVMVGIGHKRDYTILDEIAAGRFDTPSKVGAHIFQIIIRNAENAFNNFMECINLAQQILLVTESELSKTIANIKQDVYYNIEFSYQNITVAWQQLIENAQKSFVDIEQQLEMLMREILCQSPTAVLSKGFAMATSVTGEIITSCKVAVENKIFKLTFHDGTLRINDSCSDN